MTNYRLMEIMIFGTVIIYSLDRKLPKTVYPLIRNKNINEIPTHVNIEIKNWLNVSS